MKPSGTPKPASGIDRAALVLLALGETHGAPIWKELTDDEAAALTRAMARLGSVERTFVDAALDLFQGQLSSASGLAGTVRTTEALVTTVLPQERAAPILERLRAPETIAVWDRLAGLTDQVLADYLAGEHAQTVAVILSRLASQQSAAVLTRLDPDFALDCLERMTAIDSVDPAVLSAIEATLDTHLIQPNTGPAKADPSERIADIFNVIDKRAAETLLERWRGNDAETAEKVRALMFTFDDFIRLSPAVIQTLMRDLDKDLLALALKGASEELRRFFLDQMSMRAARMLEDQMMTSCRVRLRDVQAAQAKVVAIARQMEARGELSLRIAADDAEEMVE